LESFFGVSLPPAITGEVVNLPAAGIALILTVILVLGIRLSSAFNFTVTTIKLAVVLFFIVFGIFFVNTANWSPFVPSSVPGAGANAVGTEEPSLLQYIVGIEPSAFGSPELLRRRPSSFFAYIGFDTVATAAEETRNPQRDLPIGILGVPRDLHGTLYPGLADHDRDRTLQRAGPEAPMASVFRDIGLNWAAGLVSIGAIMGPDLGNHDPDARPEPGRLRDESGQPPAAVLRPVPPALPHPLPHTIITGVVVAIMAAFIDLSRLAELVNIGTLFAFVLVSIGVIVLRRTQPNLRRAFRTPLVPVVPILAILASLYLMVSLPVGTWWRFVIWMVLGVVVYFAYSRSHSRLGRSENTETTREA
jgi:APA family basic amino acid/polyamine antiporter